MILIYASDLSLSFVDSTGFEFVLAFSLISLELLDWAQPNHKNQLQYFGC
jgi:hypothetical protein